MQMTIRNVDAPLRQRLEAEAKRKGVSLNRAAIDALHVGLGVPPKTIAKRDLSDIFGSMTSEDARAIEEAVAWSDAASIKGQIEDDEERARHENRRRHKPIHGPRRRPA